MDAKETLVAEREVVPKQQLYAIYESTFPRVAAFISKRGGSFDDARDIFHDALIIYFEAGEKENLPLIVSEEAYVLGIVKHLWIRKHAKEQKHVFISDMEHEMTIPDDYFPTVENKRLLRFLEVAGKKCLDLLQAFYYRQESLQKLVHRFGYSSEHSASAQKYKCLEKIRTVVKAKSMTYEDFTE